MPRKTLKTVKKELKEIGYYKWQFLRRNKEYQKDFDEYANEKEDALFRFENEDKFEAWDQSRVDEFYEKWGINYPCDYKEKTPDLLFGISHDAEPVVLQRRVPVKRPRGEVVTGYNYTSADTLIRHGKKEIRMPHTAVFCINLNHPKGKIMPLFEEKLDNLLKRRKKMSRQYRTKPKFHQAQLTPLSPRKRNLYDEYLRIWDFVEKNKDKKTWKQITKKLYPKGSVSVHMLIERHKACKELIEGGYVDIK